MNNFSSYPKNSLKNKLDPVIQRNAAVRFLTIKKLNFNSSDNTDVIN
jgi:hypothetical protein